MQKRSKAIVLCIATIINYSVCMETHPSDLRNINLLEHNLEQLIAIETSGNFSQKLLDAEIIAIELFKQFSSEDRKTTWDENAIKLAKLVSERPTDKYEIFSMLKKEDNADKLEQIVNRNPCILNAYEQGQTNLLHRAVLHARSHCIKKLLDLKANPNCLDSQGWSPLHVGIEHDVPISIIQDLLAAGALANLCNLKGKTPFKTACEKNSPAVEAFEQYGYLFFSALWPYKNPFEFLKNNGLNLKHLDNEPIGSREGEFIEIALEKLFNHINNSDSEYQGSITINASGLTLCHANKEECDTFFGKEVLSVAKDIIQKRTKVKDLLLSAAQGNNNEDLKKILNNYHIGAPLQYEMLKTCIENSNTQALIICLDNEFNPNRYHKALSLLHCAVGYNNPRAIKLLADHNADLVPLNKQHQTPLSYAISLKCFATELSKRQECITAMIDAIKNRILTLCNAKKSQCGLPQHIFNTNRFNVCEECIRSLAWQLNVSGHSRFIHTIESKTSRHDLSAFIQTLFWQVKPPDHSKFIR